MGSVGISLIVASVVWVIIRPPSWLAPWLWRWRQVSGKAIGSSSSSSRSSERASHRSKKPPNGRTPATAAGASSPPQIVTEDASDARKQMPPPPPPTFITSPASSSVQGVTIEEPSEEQTTPKATASDSSNAVPSFILDDASSASSSSSAGVPPTISKAATTERAPNSMMPPPPRPSVAAPGRLPSPANPPRLPQFPAPNSAQRARGPVPNRGPPSSSGLAPPPTHSSIPSKPSRKVMLTPGHSPLDWARISGPNADLRGVPPSTPYLRVTPSMLKKQNGRKGTDAWMGLNGKVYNISPYAEFHPGGIPELLRGAGKDGTKLFGEIHPWVNYDTMLAACLVGLLVDESDGPSEMEQMD